MAVADATTADDDGDAGAFDANELVRHDDYAYSAYGNDDAVAVWASGCVHNYDAVWPSAVAHADVSDPFGMADFPSI